MDSPHVIKSAQRPNFKGDGEIPEELSSPKRRSPREHIPEESEHGPSFIDWLLSVAPIFLAGLGIGLFFVFLFSPASVVEVLEEGAEAM